MDEITTLSQAVEYFSQAHPEHDPRTRPLLSEANIEQIDGVLPPSGRTSERLFAIARADLGMRLRLDAIFQGDPTDRVPRGVQVSMIIPRPQSSTDLRPDIKITFLKRKRWEIMDISDGGVGHLDVMVTFDNINDFMDQIRDNLQIISYGPIG